MNNYALFTCKCNDVLEEEIITYKFCTNIFSKKYSTTQLIQVLLTDQRILSFQRFASFRGGDIFFH